MPQGCEVAMKMNVRGNDYFETPWYIFEQLNKVFDFEIDVACTSQNCLAPVGFFYDLGADALQKNWNGRCFCNPPFSRKADFIKKADAEVKRGICPICVMILPTNCVDTHVFHEVVEGKYHYEILRGRISFIDPVTKKAKKGNNSGTLIVYFKKKVEI